MHRRLQAAVPLACGALLMAAAGCTGASSGDRAAPGSGSSSAAAVAPPAQPVVLRCADAGSGDEPRGPGDLTLAGVTLEGLARPTTGLPSATEAGLLVPAGSSQRFRKAPAYVPAGAGPVTVELVGPAADQALVWVPAGDWSGGRPDLRPWMATTVVLDGCRDRDVTYFGGVLADRPGACLDLRIERTGRAGEQTRFRLDGGPCSAEPS